VSVVSALSSTTYGATEPQRHRGKTGRPIRRGRPARQAGATGREAETAWLVDCNEAFRLFGPPRVDLQRMLDWTADWVQRGGASLGKPTHYEARDGKY